MLLKEFARTGRKVSEIGMGTYYDPLWIASAFLGWKRGSKEKLQALASGFDAGITLVDTAEIYQSEGIVARALEGRNRDELFLASKVWTNHLHHDDLIKAFESSLRRLGVSYLDLYQVHWPSGKVPIAETVGAMESLVNAGKLGSIGVSNFSLEQMERANAALSKTQLASAQMNYSLTFRTIEEDILPYCQANGMTLLAYYPLGHGRLTSDQRLETKAHRYGKTKAQIALRWLADKAGVIPIPRASRAVHVKENGGASGWALEPGDASELDRVFSPST